jgi:hypothetical protein
MKEKKDREMVSVASASAPTAPRLRRRSVPLLMSRSSHRFSL